MGNSSKRKPAAKAKPQGVVIAGPNPGVVDGHFFASVSGLLIHDAANRQAITRLGGAMWLESSPRIYAARCDLVRTFLDETENWPEPPQWLLFIDADMTFEPTVVDQMLDTIERHKDKDIKILGGLCFAGGRGQGAYPTLVVVDDAANWDPSQPMSLGRAYDYPKDTLVKVNATGGAFLMIHRDVLEAMEKKFDTFQGHPNPYPWFREYEQNGQQFGEDIFFGVAAGSIGYSTWVDTAVKIGHRKTYTLDEQSYEANKEALIQRAEGALDGSP